MKNTRTAPKAKQNTPVTPESNTAELKAARIAELQAKLQANREKIQILTPSNSITSQQRSDAAKKAANSRTPQQRIDAAKKAWVTIRAKQAARKAAVAELATDNDAIQAELEVLQAAN